MALGSPGPLLHHPGHPNFFKKGGCEKVVSSLLKFYLNIEFHAKALKNHCKAKKINEKIKKII